MKRKIQEARRKKIRRIVVIWSILGVIGLLWILYFAVFGVMELCENIYARTAETIDRGDNAEWAENGLQEGISEKVNNDSPDNIATGMYDDIGGIAGGKDRDDRTYTTNCQKLASAEEKETSKLAEECQALYEAHKESLVLVNKDHELGEGIYEDTLRSICNGRLQASDYLYEDLVDLLAAAKEDGYQYWIASAYRSQKRQQELVDEDVERYMKQGMSYKEALEKTYELTMPVGKSEHETGLALDILCSENVNMDTSQANEPGNQWLAKHAHEYGFILRYPANKEDITGISYEPWHFRYVGKESAIFLWENELTLEEFWEYLNIAVN